MPAPPGPTTTLQWNVIKDFSPGIHNVVSPNHPDGAAQETNTYRCHSVQGGALTPLPKLVNTYHHDAVATSPATSTNTVSEEYRISGIHINDPVFWGGETETGIYQNNSELYLAYEWWDNSNGGHLNLAVDRYFRNYANTPHWQRLWDNSASAVYNPIIQPRKCEFVTQRSNHNSPGTLGPSVITWCFTGYLRHFPDDTNPGIDSVIVMPGDKSGDNGGGGLVSPDGIVGHQGRVVVFPLTLSSVGADQIYTNSEAFYWTVANDLRSLGTNQYSDISGTHDQYFQSAVYTEDPTGYQVYQSLSAAELLLIKARQGAVMIRGSLDDFESVNYPYVRGTGLSKNRGCNSPKGFVYPVDAGGVWLWEGGDLSTHITKQLTNDFWRPAPFSPAQASPANKIPDAWGYRYSKCSQWNQFCMFPNNWLWDTDFDGWWKIDNHDSITIHQWVVDWRGLSCYGTPSGFRHSGDPAIYEYNKVEKASSYSWQSHPLSSTIERYGHLRDVIIVSTGHGSVRVTITSAQDPEGQSAVVQVRENFKPDMQNIEFSVQGSHIVVRVESVADNPNLPAPDIHEIRYSTIATSMVGSVD